jgi:hypothetical protein
MPFAVDKPVPKMETNPPAAMPGVKLALETTLLPPNSGGGPAAGSTLMMLLPPAYMPGRGKPLKPSIQA